MDALNLAAILESAGVKLNKEQQEQLKAAEAIMPFVDLYRDLENKFVVEGDVAANFLSDLVGKLDEMQTLVRPENKDSGDWYSLGFKHNGTKYSVRAIVEK